MTENIVVIKRFKPFILGYCWCGCGTEFEKIKKRGNFLRRYVHNHHMVGRTKELCPSWKGGRKLDRNYWMLFMPDYRSSNKHGYVYEHVYFYQEYYQCSLLPWGIVHHIIPVSKDYCNNMIWNLMGMTRNEHMRLHMTIDMSDRRCSNPVCKTPNETKIKKDGRPLWLNDKKGGWLCDKCDKKRRYYGKKEIIKIPFKLITTRFI